MRIRPLFRIHLSTAIALMFVAGGLIWANTTIHIESLLRGDTHMNCSFNYGFPFPYVTNFGQLHPLDWLPPGYSIQMTDRAIRDASSHRDNPIEIVFIKDIGWLGGHSFEDPPTRLPIGTTFDLFFAFATLVLTVLAAETIGHRRVGADNRSPSAVRMTAIIVLVLILMQFVGSYLARPHVTLPPLYIDCSTYACGWPFTFYEYSHRNESCNIANVALDLLLSLLTGILLSVAVKHLVLRRVRRT